MALEIEFLDGRPVMEVGQRTRLRVLQQDAAGRRNPMRLEQVAFTFAPVTWGRVSRTADPAIGLLEVIEVVEPDDLLLAPVYRIEASLTNFSEQTIQPERRVRLIATAVEVELGFEVGFADKWRRFETQQLKRPIDWTKARTSDPARTELVVREGRPYLRLRSLADLPAQVSISFPNGETATLRLEGKLAAWEPGHQPEPILFAPPAPAPAPVAAPAAAVAPEPDRPLVNTSLELEPVPEPERLESEPAGAPLPAALPAAPPASAEPELVARVEAAPPPEPAAPAAPALPPGVLREEIGKLKRYVSSFSGALRAQPEGETAAKVRERIGREVERVWGLLQSAPEDARAELSELFRAATDVLPDARRAAAGLGHGVEAGSA